MGERDDLERRREARRARLWAAYEEAAQDPGFAPQERDAETPQALDAAHAELSCGEGSPMDEAPPDRRAHLGTDAGADAEAVTGVRRVPGEELRNAIVKQCRREVAAHPVDAELMAELRRILPGPDVAEVWLCSNWLAGRGQAARPMAGRSRNRPGRGAADCRAAGPLTHHPGEGEGIRNG